MKIIILVGGFGTRISEETNDKPKPLVLIDSKPILWHLMKIFLIQGFSDFTLALGYKSEIVKRWLIDLHLLSGNIKVDVQTGRIERLEDFEIGSKWQVTALETGLNSQTGTRIRMCMERYPDETIIVTYGDGLANINLKELIKFHNDHGKLATVTAVRPPARFGHIQLNGSLVSHFGEKNQSDVGWINGGFFVLNSKVLEYFSNEDEPFETGALPRLVSSGELMAYQHFGYWQPMDTLRDKHELSKLAISELPPWLNI